MTTDERPNCYPRIGYRRLRTAIKARKHFNEMFGGSHDIYSCSDCGKYHLIHRPRKGYDNGPEN